MDPIFLLVYIVGLLIALGIAYVVIQNAVTSALRQARREQHIEDYVPEKATWVDEQQRAFLRALADEAGRKLPTSRS